jgi:hypothetical protein
MRADAVFGFTLAITMALSTAAYAQTPEKLTGASNSPALPDAFARMSQRRIFFGHQSVGGNVLDGIAKLASETPGTKLEVLQSEDKAALANPGLVHAMVGHNEDPASKIAHFEKLMTEGPGSNADVAFFKFCYVDFTPETDVEKLFSQYQASLKALKEKRPNVTFVHLTVPLTTVQTGLKGWLKNTLGSGAWGVRENMKRHQYNELLRKAYEGREPLFDLAKYESTAPDGKAEAFTRDGRSYPSLVRGYTDDGGHLNRLGQRVLAEKFVSFLGGLPVASPNR